MKNFLKEIIDKFPVSILINLYAILMAGRDFFSDYIRFIKFSGSNTFRVDKKKAESYLIKQYHVIEKALSLPHTRIGFGYKQVLDLISKSRLYYKKFGYSDVLEATLDNLFLYKNFNQSLECGNINSLHENIHSLFNEIKEYNSDCSSFKGGVKLKSREKIFSGSKIDFEKFVSLRHSIRDFSSSTVSDETIKKAIEIASFSPSACNRQAWKVYIFSGDNKNKILQYQNGNRGFSQSINKVVLIVGKISAFYYSERHQVYIDGGMFSMVLIYALHSLGLGTCPLNTSYTASQDKKLRKFLNLPVDEVPIMMIGIGALKDKFYVAKSARKNVEEISEFI